MGKLGCKERGRGAATPGHHEIRRTTVNEIHCTIFEFLSEQISYRALGVRCTQSGLRYPQY